jgi:hypothetical protein
MGQPQKKYNGHLAHILESPNANPRLFSSTFLAGLARRLIGRGQLSNKTADATSPGLVGWSPATRSAQSIASSVSTLQSFEIFQRITERPIGRLVVAAIGRDGATARIADCRRGFGERDHLFAL